MTATFEPRNEIEQKLVAAQEGKLDGHEFMKYLMETEVFLPVKDQLNIGGFQASDKAVPLTLKTEDGMEVLVLFSSPERAKDFLADYPSFEGGILAELKWVIEHMGSGLGITLNPGLEVGLDLEPEMLAEMMG